MAETRERIVAAGSELVHTFPSWEWSALTFRAVAERAGVGERTVYRHFPTERHLHDAVMQRLEEEAGVSYEGMTIDSIAAVTARVFASLGAYAAAPTAAGPTGSTIEAEDDRRKQAVRAAVDGAAPAWTPAQREAAAAALDVVWSIEGYERLAVSWGLDPDRATDVVGWLLRIVADAIAADDPPPTGPATPRGAGR